MASHDMVIRGGMVYDGTGAPGRLADVALDDGRIAAIGAGSTSTPTTTDR
jgi:N-acyl-D-aspartate/D-glutamate deacylase